jgi:hypothetical protein
MKKINLNFKNKKNEIKNLFITENNNNNYNSIFKKNNSNINLKKSLFKNQNFSEIQSTNSLINNHSNINYNNYNTELPKLNSNKNLIENYTSKNSILNNNNNINNNKTNKKSRKQLILNQFNKLYGISDDFESKYKAIKNSRNISLENYQKNLLLISTNLTKESAMKLHNSFRNIKEITEETKPLPPFNYNALYEHSLKEAYSQRMKKNKKFLREIKYLKQFERKDSYEIEQEKINKHKHLIIHKENPNVLKLYQFLPKHIVNAVLMKRKKN